MRIIERNDRIQWLEKSHHIKGSKPAEYRPIGREAEPGGARPTPLSASISLVATFIFLSAHKGLSKFSGLFSYWFKTACVHKGSRGPESFMKHLELWISLDFWFKYRTESE